jgi:hypothetical protein
MITRLALLSFFVFFIVQNMTFAQKPVVVTETGSGSFQKIAFTPGGNIVSA